MVEVGRRLDARGEGDFGEHLRHVVVQPARVRREQQRLVLQILERDGALFREQVPRIEHDHHRIVHEVDVLKRAAADQREKAQVDIAVGEPLLHLRDVGGFLNLHMHVRKVQLE